MYSGITCFAACFALVRPVSLPGSTRSTRVPSGVVLQDSRKWLSGKELGGGQEGSRTPDTRIFSPVLYQLSYLPMMLYRKRL